MDRTWMALLLLPGCGGLGYYGGDDDDDAVLTTLPPPPPPPPTTTPTTTTPTTTTPTTTTPTTTTPTTTTTGGDVVLKLNKVLPDYGSDAGGDRITLKGTFDEGTAAFVDGVSARVVSSTPNELEIETPGSARDGWVEVMVESGARRASLPDAFQYWADREGETGAVGVVSYVEYQGGYWDGGTPPPAAYGRFAFVGSGDWEFYQEYSGAIGDCRYSRNKPAGLDWDMAKPGTPAFDEVDPGASFVRFVGPSGEIVKLNADATWDAGWFSNLSVPVANVVPAALYDLDPVSGDPDWPGFDLPNSLKIAGTFAMALPHFDQPNLPKVDRTIDLEWNNSGADYVVVWIRRDFWSLGFWVTDGYMTCAVPDTGAYTIPSGKWPDWYEGDVLYMKVGRVFDRREQLPHDHSTSHVVGVYWDFGAAETTR